MLLRNVFPFTSRLLYLKSSILSAAICLALQPGFSYAEDYFAPEAVEREGGASTPVDLSTFSKAGGQAPGIYSTEVYVNGNFVDEREIQYELDDGKLIPALNKGDLVGWGTENNATPAFMLLNDGQKITKISSYIPDARIVFDFVQQRLDISIPQEYVRKNAQGYINRVSGMTACRCFSSTTGCRVRNRAVISVPAVTIMCT
ncbi:MAG: Outer membrane usher protein SfmD [Candidatus Erwinia impunctatus]|nr:Outer membrane usher protein SfmD [Culicoides impunctatus]